MRYLVGVMLMMATIMGGVALLARLSEGEWPEFVPLAKAMGILLIFMLAVAPVAILVSWLLR